jgi:hypothetical protein
VRFLWTTGMLALWFKKDMVCFCEGLLFLLDHINAHILV